jgi:predicted O-linked N-acetylglucosamine transferase (SPINDLY family)
VLTCVGEAFAARVAGSLLRAAGLPELITTSLEQYEQRALELAHSPSMLAMLRERLASRRDSAALFDTARFCRHLEQAYRAMRERAAHGEPPQSFTVASA